MHQLTRSLRAWGRPDFEDILKQEIAGLNAEELPLQQALSQGSYVCDGAIRVMVIRVVEEADYLRAKTGIFYSSIIAGCSCADDPTPVDKLSEYCVISFAINKQTAETTATLLQE